VLLFTAVISEHVNGWIQLDEESCRKEKARAFFLFQLRKEVKFP